MDRQRSNDLEVWQIQRTFPVDFDKVIDEFASNGVERHEKISIINSIFKLIFKFYKIKNLKVIINY